MSSHTSSPFPRQAAPIYDWRVFVSLATLIIATFVAYHNSLSGPFIFDDSSAITQNPSIRSLWPLSSVLMPPAECTVAGRPLANLTFAINYAMGGINVRVYHATNLLLHALSALTLFGIIRRTLARLPRFNGPTAGTASLLAGRALQVALAAATLWAVHPLLTESVTYISQRTEVLMSFFYLLTLYTFVRATESGGWWWLASIAACFAGVGSKEGMVTAPVLVLLYDRTFVSGTFWRSWKTHRAYYLGLAASWLLLAFLLSGLSHRSVGFGLGVSWLRYALTECEAVLLYFRLILWPHPLIFDYGAIFAGGVYKTVLLPVFLTALLITSAILMHSRPRIGFCLAAFFLILAPTSSVVPVATQPIAENRVYLASAAIVVLGVTGLYALAVKRSWVILTLAGAALIVQTIRRNEVYQNVVSLWSDNIAKRPIAPRGFENLGEALHAAGKLDAARKQFEEAIRLEPAYAGAHHNLGTTLHELGLRAEALHHFEEAVRLKPEFPTAHSNLGTALLDAGQLEKAVHHLREAIRFYEDDWRLKPDLPEAHNSLGNALLFQGDLGNARIHYAAAIRLKPDFVQAQMNLGVVLRELGELNEAKHHLEIAVQLNPKFAEAHFNLGLTYARLREPAAAEARLKTALTLKPDFVQAHKVLGELLSDRGALQEAQTHFETALVLRPDDPDVRTRLEQLRTAQANTRKE